MQPNASAPPPPIPGQMPVPPGQYDFITDPGSRKPKKGFTLPSGGSKASRILLVVGGFVILIVFFIIGSSILGSADKARKQQLIDVVAQQKELIRVAEIGVKKAKTAEGKNIAITTSLTLTSEQSELIAALKKLGVKADTKTIGGANKKTDELLTQAEQANQFDEVFIKKMREDLLKYAKSVQTAYKNNESKSTKEALKAQYDNAATLANFKEE